MFTQHGIVFASFVFFYSCNKLLDLNLIPSPEKYGDSKKLWKWRDAMIGALHSMVTATMATIRYFCIAEWILILPTYSLVGFLWD